MSGLDWSLSATVNGEWGPDNTAGTEDDGTEYTTGRTAVGTAVVVELHIFSMISHKELHLIHYILTKELQELLPIVPMVVLIGLSLFQTHQLILSFMLTILMELGLTLLIHSQFLVLHIQ